MSRISAFIIGIVLSLACITGALAQTFAPEVCDPEIRESLNAKAWLEAEKDIVESQNLLFKPDSVLEYSCFTQFADLTGYYAGPMFSENQSWGPVFDDQALDFPLEDVVTTTVIYYIYLNFGPTFLGERTPRVAAGPAPPDGTYLCEAMGYVWYIAKCWNFATGAQDGFFSYEQYRDIDDVRRLPKPCDKDARWPDMLDTAKADPPWRPAFLGTSATIYDAVSPRLLPAACGDAIMTGIMVRGDNRPEYADGVCSNPGCIYNGGGCI